MSKGFYIQTYGCQMNVSDSDRMKAILEQLGYESYAQPELADIILINTCSIREKAENKIHTYGGDIKYLKKENPKLRIGVTGCVAQQEKEQILVDMPYVDFVLGPDNIDDIPLVLENLEQNQALRKDKAFFVRAEFENDPSRVWKTKTLISNPGPSTFVNVMKGCDHFCSYCIVPMTRGREKSRPIADIIDDVRDLCSRGVREITFLGQNINTFGKKSGETLAELFKRVHDIEDLKRIRFTTSHPGDLEDELIDCFRILPKLCSNFHLPFQSGSDKILRAMRRFYTRSQYLEKVAALREARPDIAFSTDIIVAFPGETDQDFQATLSLAKEVKFDNAYSFIYSPRPGTSAFSRENTIPESVKLARLTELQIELKKDSKELHLAEIGKIKEVLIEGISKKDPQKLSGRTSQNVPVHIDRRPDLSLGDIAQVYISDATLTHLRGNATPTPPFQKYEEKDSQTLRFS
jgi:tRNA-2-methylthio-N6-dimethylallyladenosine synthase